MGTEETVRALGGRRVVEDDRRHRLEELEGMSMELDLVSVVAAVTALLGEMVILLQSRALDSGP